MEYIIQENTLIDIAEAIREVKGDTSLFNPVDMPAAIRSISSGGEELNFSVVDYASEADLPLTAEENTIAVFVIVDMTSYILSPSEPENPAQGMVWIKTGTSSSTDFNALKENAIQIYPQSSAQYKDGAWITVNTKVYQNGTWNGIVTALYWFKDGSFNTDTFGSTSSSYHSINGNNMVVTWDSEVKHTTLVDVTPYRMFTFTIAVYNYGRPSVMLRNSVGTALASSGQKYGVGTYTLDVSSINEPVYIQINCNANAASNYSALNDIGFIP